MCGVCGLELEVTDDPAPDATASGASGVEPVEAQALEQAQEPRPAVGAGSDDQVVSEPEPMASLEAETEPESAPIEPATEVSEVSVDEPAPVPPMSAHSDTEFEHTVILKKSSRMEPQKPSARVPGEPAERVPFGVPNRDSELGLTVQPWSEPERRASETWHTSKPAATEAAQIPVKSAPETVEKDPESAPELHEFAFPNEPGKRGSKKPLVIGAAVLAGVIALGGVSAAVVVNLANTQAVAAQAEQEDQGAPTAPFAGWGPTPKWSIELEPGTTVEMLDSLLITASDTQLELRSSANGKVQETLDVTNVRLWQLGGNIVGLADGEVLAIDGDANVNRVKTDTAQARIRGTALIIERDGAADVITPTLTHSIPAPTPEAKLLGMNDEVAIWTTQRTTVQLTSLTGEIQSTVDLTPPEGYSIGKWLGTFEGYVAVTWVGSEQTVLALHDYTTGSVTSDPVPLSPAEAEKPVWAVAVGNQPALLASVQMSATTGAITPLETQLTNTRPFGASVIGENAAEQQVLIDAKGLRTLRIQEVSALGLSSDQDLIAREGQKLLAFAPEQTPRKEQK